MRQYSVLSGKSKKDQSGDGENYSVPPPTPPADPVVCTMLFSRIVERPNARRMLMERTAMGIEAETVSPARRPT